MPNDRLGPLMLDSPNIDFSRQTVVVLGDVMLDSWIYGHVERISPEAPVPVLRADRCREMLGGAGNVAHNIAALGGRAVLIGVIGDDAAGRRVRELADESGKSPASVVPRLVVSTQASTIRKIRYVAAGQQVLRVDEETPLPVDASVAQQLVEYCEEALTGADAVILSDYAKGALTDDVLQQVIFACRSARKPVVADPKSRDFSRYSSVTVLTPNRLEALAGTGIDCDDEAMTEEAGRVALTQTGAEAVLITRGADGLSIIPRGSPAIHIGTRARSVFDVSGAGDTLVATLALSLASGASLIDAARLANAAAGIAVEKAGTATVSPNELRDAMSDAERVGHNSKIVPLDSALELVARWRVSGLKIGFTNGCFDLLHPGHVTLLAKARSGCDRLIVGLNGDASVKRLKGPDRPIQNEMARATVMASLGSVDLVMLFSEDTPDELIEAIRPDLLVKGADYMETEVVGASFVRSYGGRVYLVPLEWGHSTTGTISRITSALETGGQ
jgi:D-beta-D-heptose 7-phosphate kinase / D-beta-D-heptose 1-phosphate adenosyltransferase